jgi:hypothetical protein
MATTCKLIAKSVLTSNATSIEFTSIPSTYTDLWCVCSLRSDRSATSDTIVIEFNGATTNLSSRTINGNGSSVFSSTFTYIRGGSMNASTSTSSTFASAEFYVPNYGGSANKSVSAVSATENNATEAFAFASAGLWSNTAAITSVKITPAVGPNLVSGSSAFLYGITKA